MTAPVIETARLRLRPQEARDWPPFRALMTSARARFMGGPFGENTAWGMFCSDTAHWEFFGHGGLTVEAGDRAVGQVSIICPPRFPQEELGWMLYDGGEGRGYATEAARALRDWYYTQHPAPVRLVSYVNPDNAASARVAERLGAVRTRDLPPLDPEDHVYLHPAPERLQ